LKIFNSTLLILIISCSNKATENNVRKHLDVESEYISVKIPIPDSLRFYKSDYLYMDDNDDYNYIDSIHQVFIHVSPTYHAAVKNFIWTRSEEDHLMYSRSEGHLLPASGSFKIPLQNMIGRDSAYSSYLIYHTDVRLSSGQNIKSVEYVKYIETKKGWCRIQIFRNYDSFNILNDINWSRTFEPMKITIKKEFRG
jgi:hypothetical protein